MFNRQNTDHICQFKMNNRRRVRQKLIRFVLNAIIKKFRERNRQSCDEKSLSSSGGLKIQQLNESLMAGQIREAVLVSEMTDLKQRLVCLEQQVKLFFSRINIFYRA